MSGWIVPINVKVSAPNLRWLNPQLSGVSPSSAPDAKHGAGICTPTSLGHKMGVDVGTLWFFNIAMEDGP